MPGEYGVARWLTTEICSPKIYGNRANTQVPFEEGSAYIAHHSWGNKVSVQERGGVKTVPAYHGGWSVNGKHKTIVSWCMISALAVVMPPGRMARQGAMAENRWCVSQERFREWSEVGSATKGIGRVGLEGVLRLHDFAS